MDADTAARLDVEALHMAVGPDGVPVVDHPGAAAARASRYADELAATAEQVLRLLREQHERETRAVELLRDALGAMHVELDELASTVAGDGREVA